MSIEPLVCYKCGKSIDSPYTYFKGEHMGFKGPHFHLSCSAPSAQVMKYFVGTSLYCVSDTNSESAVLEYWPPGGLHRRRTRCEHKLLPGGCYRAAMTHYRYCMEHFRSLGPGYVFAPYIPEHWRVLKSLE